MEEVLVLEKPKQGRRTEAKHARCKKHADCGANDLEDAAADQGEICLQQWIDDNKITKRAADELRDILSGLV